MPTDSTVSISVQVPTVSVTSVPTAGDPNGLRTFDFEFTGNSEMAIQPTMMVAAGAVVGGVSGTHLNAAAIDAVTLKQPSNTFRVNPEEPGNPFSALPEVYNCTNPSVAMDADGNFVVVWQADIPDTQIEGTGSDIFGRMYTPTGSVDLSQDIEFTGAGRRRLLGHVHAHDRQLDDGADRLRSWPCVGRETGRRA